MTTGRRVIPWCWTLLRVLVICACVLADGARAQEVSVPGNEETDRAALAAFYHATNGPNWKNSENWLSDLPLATWYGVEIHFAISHPGYSTIRRIASLNLHDNGLTGSLPSEFAQLVTLRTLDLSDNELTGDIPTVLGELDIEVLGQSVLSPGADPCELTVYYPDGYRAVFGDSCIYSLDLSNNQFTGRIPVSFRHFHRLSQLDLSHNQLTGSIPAELGEMDHDHEFRNDQPWLVCSWLYCVARLDLSHNQLTGIVPEELGELRGVQVLNLSHNQLTGSLPTMSRCRSTQEDTPLPRCFIGFDELDLSNNQFTESIPVVIPMGQLGSAGANYGLLDLSHNQLAGPLPDPSLWDNGRHRVGTVDLSHNRLTGGIPPALSTELMGRLGRVDLSHNFLTGTIPAELFIDSGGYSGGIEFLDLSGNELTGTIPPVFRHAEELGHLDLSDNQLTGTIPLHLGESGLGFLDLSDNRLRGTIPAAVLAAVDSNSSSLTVLDLSSNELTGTIPAEVGDAIFLQVLNLSDNGFTGTIPPELANAGYRQFRRDEFFDHYLRVLDLSNNQLRGLLPPELGSHWSPVYFLDGSLRSTGMEELDLSGNTLVGPLSAPMKNAAGVTRLDISRTELCVPQDAEFQAWVAGIQDFTSSGVSCTVPNGAPVPVGTLAPLTIGVNDGAVAVDVASAFRDPDGDPLTYEAISSAPGVAEVSVVGSTMAVTPVASGTAVVTVMATDRGGSNTTAAQMFVVTVRPPGNQAPEPVGTLAPVTIGVGEAAVTVEVAGAFRDPDGDRLTYGANSSLPAVASVTVSGSRVTVTAVSAGAAIVTVTATDTAGSNTSAVQRLGVTVSEGCTNDDLGPVSGTVMRTGSWTGECTSVHYSGGRYARYYSFTLLRSSAVRIDLMSAVDTWLALRNGSGTGSELVEENDDVGGGNLNSRIETTLAAGTYTIEATTFYPFVTGSFTLTLSVERAFTDHAIVGGATPVKAVHFMELRTRIEGVRTAVGLGRFAWTDAVLSAGVTPVRLVHLLELRWALGAAYTAAGRSAPSWADAAPTAGTTPIRAVHLMELRAAVVALE